MGEWFYANSTYACNRGVCGASERYMFLHNLLL